MATESITVRALDHLVLTAADIDATIGFYKRVLGMTRGRRR